MRLSLHVAEKGPVVCPPPDSLHPTQGALPCLRLDSQPPLQLLATFSSLAILPNIESGAGDGFCAVDVCAVDGVRRDAAVFATCFGLCGLATCFGASIVMEGSGAAEPVAVCDAAGPHSKTVANTPAAEGATTLNENLMTIPLEDGHAAPMHPRDHTQLPSRKLRTWPLGVKRFLPMTAIDHVAKRTRTTRLKIVASDVVKGFGPRAMSNVRLECAPKRTSTDRSEFMRFRRSPTQPRSETPPSPAGRLRATSRERCGRRGRPRSA